MEYVDWAHDCNEKIKKLQNRYQKLEIDDFGIKTIQNIKSFCCLMLNDISWFDEYLKNFQKIETKNEKTKQNLSCFLEDSWKTYKNMKKYAEDVFSKYKDGMSKLKTNSDSTKKKEIDKLNKKFSDSLTETTKYVKNKISNIKTNLSRYGIFMPSTLRHLIYRENLNVNDNSAKIGVLNLIDLSLIILKDLKKDNKYESEKILKNYINRFRTSLLHCSKPGDYYLSKMNSILSSWDFSVSNSNIIETLNSFVTKTKEDFQSQLVPYYKTFIQSIEAKLKSGEKNPFKGTEFKVISSHIRKKTKKICEKNIEKYKDNSNENYEEFKTIADDISEILVIQVMCENNIIRFINEEYDNLGNSLKLGGIATGCICGTLGLFSIGLVFSAILSPTWTGVLLTILGIYGMAAAGILTIPIFAVGAGIAYGVGQMKKKRIIKNFENTVGITKTREKNSIDGKE